MTTPRTRRNKTQQAQDVLRALLKDQGHKAKRLREMADEAEAEADKTRRALEVLGMEMLPGMESLPESDDGRVVYVPRPMPLEGTGTSDDLDAPPHSWVFPTTSGAISVPVRPHRQRIGEKAEITDVWPNTGRSSSGNLSPLMESRKAKCNLCLGGIPYATEQRTEHYVVTRDDQGAERGFEYKPCSGVI